MKLTSSPTVGQGSGVCVRTARAGDVTSFASSRIQAWGRISHLFPNRPRVRDAAPGM